jgi:hypothetical protein
MRNLSQQQLEESISDFSFDESFFSANSFEMTSSFEMSSFELSMITDDLRYLLQQTVIDDESLSEEEEMPFSIEPRKTRQQAECYAHTTKTNRQKKVAFSTVETRSYAITIGDHDCEGGLPLTLDWMFNPKSTFQDVEREDEVYSRHYPARKLTSFERAIRLAEVAGIVDAASSKSQRNERMDLVEDELSLDEVFRDHKPLAVVSHAA